MRPGVLLVWSVDRPRSVAIEIPREGVALGRDLLEKLSITVGDDRISRQHARLSVHDGEVSIIDPGSRNGTFLDGKDLVVANTQRVRPFAVVRTGRSVWVIVPDVKRFRNITLSRRGRLVVGGTLASTCLAADRAAREESNLLLFGPLSIGRELARSYASTVGGPAARFDPDTIKLPLDRVLENARARTLVLELAAPLRARDITTLATWLETDLRVVTCVKEERLLAPLDEALVGRLSERRIPLPINRCDEVPTSVFDLIREHAPEAKIHATVIERCLLELRRLDEDVLFTQLRESLLRWHAATPTAKLRGEDLDLEDPFLLNHCLIAEPPNRRRKRPQDPVVPTEPDPIPVLARPAPADASWDRRRLCVDGGCFGVVGPDGSCGVCGSATPLPDPYR